MLKYNIMVLVLLTSQKLAGHHANIKDGRKANSAKAGWTQEYDIYITFNENLQSGFKVIMTPQTHGHDDTKSFISLQISTAGYNRLNDWGKD
jgi:hypothetical protein